MMSYKIGDSGLTVVLFTDADLHSPHSQSGAFMVIIGKDGSYLPVDFVSSKQKPVSNSTPMAEVIAASGYIQASLYFATELQQLLDLVAGKIRFEDWDTLLPQSVPLFVDAKEVERSGTRETKRSIDSLTTRLDRAQLLYLVEELLMRLLYVNTQQNPSDIGTKQHKSITILRELNAVVLNFEESCKQGEQNIHVMQLISYCFVTIAAAQKIDRVSGIDQHLRKCWEMNYPC